MAARFRLVKFDFIYPDICNLDATLWIQRSSTKKMPRRLWPNLGEASSIRTTGSWFPKALDQLLVVIIIPSMLSSD
jgi:hypothetical protein